MRKRRVFKERMEVHREGGESTGVERVRFLGAARRVEFREPRINKSYKSQNAQIFYSSYAFVLKL